MESETKVQDFILAMELDLIAELRSIYCKELTIRTVRKFFESRVEEAEEFDEEREAEKGDTAGTKSNDENDSTPDVQETSGE